MADSNEKDFSGKPDDVEPIDWLRPDSPQHAYVLAYLKDRLDLSERKMSSFYPRWRANELMLQAYVSLADYDRMLKSMHSSGVGPDMDDGPVAINIPFAWATVNTIVTYLLHMFAGRRPIFQVGSYRPEQVKRSKNMEMYLQYNADVVKFIRALYFFLMDGETYGVAIIRTLWKQDMKQRVLTIPPAPELIQIAAASGLPAPQGERKTEDYVSFEGNSCTNVDPYMFFPDPRVPMHEVNEKGEWVFWRAFMGKHTLLKEQALGRLKWVDKVDPARWNTDQSSVGSARGIRALGEADPGQSNDRSERIAPNFQVDQGTIEIIPKELGLGPSEVPEKWMFTILNKTQIVQAMKVELASGKHPVEVAEPNSTGYGFGNLGTVDMLGPMQKLMSWFMNSHIFNVRASLNNMFVYDPTKIETQDLLSPKPGKLIRMKNTAFGLSDPKNAIQQLQVSDVTRSHLQDFQMFGRLASDLTGATDNVRGLQDAGGRKTATEIRTSAEAGTSRLAAKGKLYSAMAFTGLAETWSLNAQANLSESFEMAVLGQDGATDSFRLTPDSIQGDFVFPVHDGTLPMDKLAMLEVWKEIFMGVSQDPQLRASYDMLEMFDWIAQLGGAQNIKSFRLNMVGQGQQMEALSGNGPLAAQGIPMQEVLAQMARGG